MLSPVELAHVRAADARATAQEGKPVLVGSDLRGLCADVHMLTGLLLRDQPKRAA